MFKIFHIVIICLVFLTACTPSANRMPPTSSASPTISPASTLTANPSATSPAPTQTAARQWFDRLSQEQKIGQVMLIGFDGTEATPELLDMITRYHVGGVILFARNVQSPAQVAHLANTLQQAARDSGHPGLFLAIDQEGGRVARLTEDKGFTEFPGAMAIAATGDPENARSVYTAVALEMRAVGLNVDFAPDLDVNNNPQNPVIGLRSFGSDPQRVAEFGAAVIDGLQKNRVLAFGKHFPGHGDTSTDSHYGLPEIAHDRDRLAQVEFVPFKSAMEAGAAGIMSAHVVFPAIEPKSGLPATLSPAVMHDLIRGEMGYTGLLVTDSLEMGALGTAGYPVPLAAAAALQAGADLLLFNRDHPLHIQAYEQVRQWIADGRIPQSRLDEAVLRALTAKAGYGLLEPAPVDENLVADSVDSQAARDLSRRVAAQSITLLRDDKHLIPLSSSAKYLVVEPNSSALGRTLGFDSLSISDAPTQSEIDQAVERARTGFQAAIVVTNDANRSPQQAALVQSLISASVPVIAVAARNPYDILAYPNVDAYLVSYGANPPAMEALAGVLKGSLKARGHLPVEIPGSYKIGDGMQTP